MSETEMLDLLESLIIPADSRVESILQTVTSAIWDSISSWVIFLFSVTPNYRNWKNDKISNCDIWSLSYQTIKNGKWNTFKPVFSVRSIFKSDSLIVSVLFSVMVATNIDRLPYTVFQVLTDSKLYPGFSLSLNQLPRSW